MSFKTNIYEYVEMSHTSDDSDDDRPPQLSGWEECVKKGKKLYQCMIDTFDNSFDKSGKIIDFRIYHVYDATFLEAEHLVIDGFKDDIHEQLLPWIHEEHQSGRLFQQKDWKPFRDPYNVVFTYYGYRKLFVYNKYYLQLVVDDWAIPVDDHTMKRTVTFHLRVYGWKEKDSSCVHHYGCVMINENTLRMPSIDWYEK